MTTQTSKDLMQALSTAMKKFPYNHRFLITPHEDALTMQEIDAFKYASDKIMKSKLYFFTMNRARGVSCGGLQLSLQCQLSKNCR